MSTFQVKLYPSGEYQKVEGQTKREVAEAVFGGPLSEIGSNHQARVVVRGLGDRISTVFYDRAA